MLRHLTADEFRSFVRFAASPWFNRNSKGLIYLEILQKSFPEMNAPALLKNNLIKKLFPKDDSDKNLKPLRSYLVKLLKEFLQQTELARQPNTQRLLLLDGLLHHQLDGEFQEELETFGQSVDPDERLFYTRYRLAAYRLFNLERGGKGEFTLESYFSDFNQFALLEKLKQSCLLMLFLRIRGKEEMHWLFQELDFLSNLHEKTIRQTPVLHAYAEMFAVLKKNEPRMDLQTLRGLLELYQSEIPAPEWKDLQNFQVNYLIGKLNRGHFSTYTDLCYCYENLFQLYKTLASGNFLTEGEHIPHQRFKNVVSVALNAGNSAWAAEFLQNNAGKIHRNYRDDLIQFCQGAICFYSGKTQDAFSHLSQVSTKQNEFYYFDIYSINMRICFETEDEKGFDAMYENVRKRLGQQNVSPTHTESYRSFYNFLKNLFRLTNEPDKTKRKSGLKLLLARIERTDPVNQKKWLLEKITTLLTPR